MKFSIKNITSPKYFFMKKSLLLILLLGIALIAKPQFDMPDQQSVLYLKTGEKYTAKIGELMIQAGKSDQFTLKQNGEKKIIKKLDLKKMITTIKKGDKVVRKMYQIYYLDKNGKIPDVNVMLLSENYYLAYKYKLPIIIKSLDYYNNIKLVSFVVLDRKKNELAEFNNNTDAETVMNKYFPELNDYLKYLKDNDYEFKLKTFRKGAYLYSPDIYKEEPMDEE